LGADHWLSHSSSNDRESIRLSVITAKQVLAESKIPWERCFVSHKVIHVPYKDGKEETKKRKKRRKSKKRRDAEKRGDLTEGAQSNNISLGPFGTWPKTAVSIVGIVLGSIILIAVYLLYRRSHPASKYLDASEAPFKRNESSLNTEKTIDRSAANNEVRRSVSELGSGLSGDVPVVPDVYDTSQETRIKSPTVPHSNTRRGQPFRSRPVNYEADDSKVDRRGSTSKRGADDDRVNRKVSRAKREPMISHRRKAMTSYKVDLTRHLSNEFKCLYEEPFNTDVTVQVGEEGHSKIFHAHWLILCA
ncbi:1137_t:CDS:2, partial [Paraglomus brasilianum]